MTTPFSSYSDQIAEFCASVQFMLLDSPLKEHAQSVLDAWCKQAGSDPDLDAGVAAFDTLATLQLPAQQLRETASIVAPFLEYCASSGLFPRAAQLAEAIAARAPHFSARIRENGSVKGETFTKNYTDIGRNDPCPCGSKKKFKKCCAPLLG